MPVAPEASPARDSRFHAGSSKAHRQRTTLGVCSHGGYSLCAVHSPTIPRRGIRSMADVHLHDDVLFACLRHCSVATLKSIKCVSRSWAQCARRTLCSAAWRACVSDREELDADGLSLLELYRLLCALKRDGISVRPVEWCDRGTIHLLNLMLRCNKRKFNTCSLVNHTLNFTGDTPLLFEMALIRASCHGDGAAVALLLTAEGIDVNAVDEEIGVTASSLGGNPLTLAAMRGHADVVALLLAADGIDVNFATGGKGLTPLHCAAMGDHATVVRLLLAADGIDVNVADANGRTALQTAMALHTSMGRGTTYRRVMDHGAVVTLLTATGIHDANRNTLSDNGEHRTDLRAKVTRQDGPAGPGESGAARSIAIKVEWPCPCLAVCQRR